MTDATTGGSPNPTPDRGRTGPNAPTAFWATVALLAVYNVTRELGWLGPRPLPAAVGLVVALTALIRATRLDAPTLGLSRRQLASGARWGGAALGLTIVVLAVAALIPSTAAFLDDPRAQLSAAELVGELVVGVLLVTVIPEELAFRGVLVGTATTLWSRAPAIALTSVLFGLWHVAPSIHTLTENAGLSDATSTTAGTVAVVAGSVAVTTVAGAVFTWLRLRSASLLAPVLAHLGTNGAAYVVAWIVAR